MTAIEITSVNVLTEIRDFQNLEEVARGPPPPNPAMAGYRPGKPLLDQRLNSNCSEGCLVKSYSLIGFILKKYRDYMADIISYVLRLSHLSFSPANDRPALLRKGLRNESNNGINTDKGYFTPPYIEAGMGYSAKHNI